MPTVDELLGLRPAAISTSRVPTPPLTATLPLEKSLESFAEMMVPEYGGSRFSPAQWVVNQNEYVKHFSGTAFIAIGAIAKKVAQQKAVVYYRRSTKAGVTKTPVEPSHPLQALFEAVNPIHTQYDLWYQMVAWRLMTGNSYWWKARNGFDVPTELWPLPSNWVWAIPSDTKFVDSYLVKAVFGGRDTVIPSEDVLHIREPNINWQGGGRFYGFPVAHAAATPIDLEESMLRKLYHQFKNFNPPGMHYTTDEKLTESQFMDLMVQLRAQQRTAEMTGDPIISHSGMKVDEFRNSVREMDYSNSLQTIMSYILAIFGTPQAVVGVSKEYNRANMIGALIAWCENTINPLLVHTGQHLTQNLAADFDDDLVVEFDPVSVDDVDAIRQDIATAQSAGAITPNEVRDVLLHKPPFDKGGNRPLLSNAVAEGFIGNGEVPDKPADDATAGDASATDSTDATDAEDQYATDGEFQDFEDSPDTYSDVEDDPNSSPDNSDNADEFRDFSDESDSADNANGTANGSRRKSPSATSPVSQALRKSDAAKANRVKQWLALHAKQEKAFASALEKYFTEQRDAIVAGVESLDGEIRRGDLEKIFNLKDATEELQSVATTQIKAAANAAMDDVFARVKQHEEERLVAKSFHSIGGKFSSGASDSHPGSLIEPGGMTRRDARVQAASLAAELGYDHASQGITQQVSANTQAVHSRLKRAGFTVARRWSEDAGNAVDYTHPERGIAVRVTPTGKGNKQSRLAVLGRTKQQQPVEKADMPASDLLISIPETAREIAWSTLEDSLSQPYWSEVTNTTLDGLWKTISDGLTDHKSNPQIAAMIASDSSGLFSMARALLIARTEVTTAMCAGQAAIIQATNDDPYADPMGVEWNSVPDSDTRPTHVKANGQVIFPGSDKFDIGGYPARFPGDLTLPAKERCNCRCAQIEVWAEDLPADSPVRRKLESSRASKLKQTGIDVAAGVDKSDSRPAGEFIRSLAGHVYHVAKDGKRTIVVHRDGSVLNKALAPRTDDTIREYETTFSGKRRMERIAGKC